FAAFSDEAERARIPDPCADETFASSVLDWQTARRAPHEEWLAWYRGLLALRARAIVPLLGDAGGHAGTWRRLGAKALSVEWRLDSARLTLLANFAAEAAAPLSSPPARETLLYATAAPGPSGLPPFFAAYFLAR